MDRTEADENELFFFKTELEYIDDADIPLEDETIKAFRRIGVEINSINVDFEKNTKNRLQWLLNLADKDLSAISSGDWTNLEYELIAFHQVLPVARGDRKVDYTARIPTKKDVELFHSSIKKELNRLIEESTAVFDTGPIVLHINPWMGVKISESDDGKLNKEIIQEHAPWVVSPVAETRWGASQYILSDLISRYAYIIRRCPECSKLFLADRKNQSYCSLKHQNYAAGRKYRKSKGLITGRKRGRPRKQRTPEKEGES